MGSGLGDVLLERTEALCPECLAPCQAAYFETDGSVELRRKCATHGVIASSFWSDAEHYRWVASIEARAAASGDGACCAPGTPGCGGDASSRRCVTVLPITDACNLECPYCFAASSPGQSHRSVAELERMMDGALAAAGGPTPIQFSGGEPTIHPDIIDLVGTARTKGFSHIEINTNGLMVANQEGFGRRLREAGADALYLQFDGLTEASYETTRGRPFVEEKRRAVEAARAAGLTVVLVPTVVKGRNDHELGDILRFAWDNRDVVRGVNFQPVRHFGRYAEDTGHLSLDGIARRLAAQTSWLGVRDLFPVPCCSASCYLGTILLPGADGPVAMSRFVDEATFLTALNNVGERRFMDVLAGTRGAADVAADVARALGVSMEDLDADILSKTLMVSATGFMDSRTADTNRMSRCCVNVVTKGGRLVPFCGYYLTDAEGRYGWRDEHAAEDADLVVAPAPVAMARTGSTR